MERMNIWMVVKLGLIGLAALLYVISLVSGVYYQVTPQSTVHGFECLILGWMGFFYDWNLIIPWASNLLIFACIPMAFFRITNFIAIPISLIAILMAIPALMVYQLMYNEAGMITEVYLLSGIYIWLGSYIVLFIALLIPTKWKKNTKPIPEEPLLTSSSPTYNKDITIGD